MFTEYCAVFSGLPWGQETLSHKLDVPTKRNQLLTSLTNESNYLAHISHRVLCKFKLYCFVIKLISFWNTIVIYSFYYFIYFYLPRNRLYQIFDIEFSPKHESNFKFLFYSFTSPWCGFWRYFWHSQMSESDSNTGLFLSLPLLISELFIQQDYHPGFSKIHICLRNPASN